MEIISHRGYWIDFEKENNQKIAFKRSFDKGFGTETDLRDTCGKIVVSHNMPSGNEISFEELLQLMDGRNLILALNIKADGLANEIESILKKYDHTNYFTFDMSIPDMVFQTERTGLRVYTGCSDVNPFPPLIEKACGVWLDTFYGQWFAYDRIKYFLDISKEVCIVSEDLHGRDNAMQWSRLKEADFFEDDKLILCTNYPEKARKYFEL